MFHINSGEDGKKNQRIDSWAGSLIPEICRWFPCVQVNLQGSIHAKNLRCS